MSRPTSEDIAREMYDAELAQEQEDTYRDLFGDEVTANELNAYAAWLMPGLQAAEALNKSSSRAVICVALAGMPDFMIDSERDDHLERPGVDMLEAIVPPSGNPMWAPYERPTSLFHQLHRMEGSDKNDKPVDLITVDREDINEKGAILKSYKLTRTGICYAHIHGRGNVTKDDLVEYWRHETQGVEVAATNHAYLALCGQEPPPDDSIYQYQSPGSEKWGILAHLKGDPTVPERYRDVSANKLGKGLKDVVANEPHEALKLLTKDDQRGVFTDILYHSGAGNPVVLVPFIDDMEKDTYKERVAKLIDVYETANPREPAAQVIGELICRATWVVVRRVMDFRMADDHGSMGHVIDKPPEPVTTEQALEALTKLDEVLGKFGEAIGAQRSGYEGELEINHPTPRIH